MTDDDTSTLAVDSGADTAPSLTTRPPIVVLARARTGTTMLRWILNEDPSVVDCAEIFNTDLDPYYPTFWKFLQDEPAAENLPRDRANEVSAEGRKEEFGRYLAWLEQRYPDQQKIFDFKYHDFGGVDSLRRTPDAAPVILAELMARNATIVHLSRINPLLQHCSQLLAEATLTWVHPKDRAVTSKTAAVQAVKVRVPAETVADALVRIDECVRIAQLWLGDYPKVLPLKYEHLLVHDQLASDVRDAIEGLIGRRLNITGRPATAKAAPPASEYVENFGEVREALAYTPYAWCTEEIDIETRYPRQRFVGWRPDVAIKAGPPTSKPLALVLAGPRAGGHLLRSTVVAAMGATNLDEPFNPLLASALPGQFEDFMEHDGAARTPLPASSAARDIGERYFDRLIQATDGSAGLMGLAYDHLRLLDWASTSLSAPPRLLQIAMKRGFKIIHVTRRDWLSRYVSLLLATQTGLWVARAGRRIPQAPQLTIDIADMLRTFAGWSFEQRLLTGWLSDSPALTSIAYEDIIDGIRLGAVARAALNRLGFGVPDEAYLTGQKIAPPLRQLVTNLDEVLSSLAGTDYAGLGQIARP